MSILVQTRARASLPPLPVLPLSVRQYHAMIDAGTLTEDDPVELLAGWLVPKMPKNPLHRAATRLLRLALEARLPIGWYVDSQEPITLADSEPEPDGAVIRGSTRDYLRRHPGPNEVAVVVEVSDSTLDKDRGLKSSVYAAASIPIYWLVNLVDRRIEVYSAPEHGKYTVSRDFKIGEEVPLVIEGQVIAQISVADLIP